MLSQRGYHAQKAASSLVPVIHEANQKMKISPVLTDPV